MTEEISSEKKKPSKTASVATGVGGGTLLVAIVNAFIDEGDLKTALLASAPSVTLALTGVCHWLQKLINDYMLDRRVLACADRIRDGLLNALDNPHITERKQVIFQKKLEELELMLTERNMQKLRELIGPMTQLEDPIIIPEQDKPEATISDTSSEIIPPSVDKIESPPPSSNVEKPRTDIIEIGPPTPSDVPDLSDPKSRIKDVPPAKRAKRIGRSQGIIGRFINWLR